MLLLNDRTDDLVFRITSVLVFLSMGVTLSAAPAEPTVVHVQKDQTLNEAIAEVEGAIKVVLPEGVTTHDDVITRRATVIIEGQGEEKTTLRADEGVPLIAQKGIKEKNDFEGRVRISDLTYDRNHKPGWSFSPKIDNEEKRRRQGPTILSTSAGGRVVFENITVYHFDFGAGPGNGQGQLLQGLGTPQYKWNSPDMPRHAYVGLHNVTINFKKDGGVRHRHNSEIGGPAVAFAADRFVFDENSLIQGHLTQHADPERTVGELPGNPPGRRGNGGALSGLKFTVWDRAVVAGTMRQVDFGQVRKGMLMRPDTVLDITGNFLECGFGDQFWTGTNVGGGHVRYRGVTLTSAEGNPWHDRGVRAGIAGDEPVDTMLVKNCRIIGRMAPIVGKRTKKLIIRDTLARGGSLVGNHVAVQAPSAGGLDVDGLTVRVNHELTLPQLYGHAIMAPEHEDAQITVKNLDSEQLRARPFSNDPKGTVRTSNVRIRQATYPELPEDAELGLLPREGFGFGVIGKKAGTPPVPGTFRWPVGRYDNPGFPFTAAQGNPSLDKSGQGAIAFDDKRLRLWFRVSQDRNMTVVGGEQYYAVDSLDEATQWRIGVAPGGTGRPDRWYAIHMAPSRRKQVGKRWGEPVYASSTKVFRHPGGERVNLDLIAVCRQKWNTWWYLISVPWSGLGIDPAEGRIRLDLAYVDVKNGEREGVWALGGRTGLLEKKTTTPFRRAALLYHSELDRLKAWFQERRQNRQN